MGRVSLLPGYRQRPECWRVLEIQEPLGRCGQCERTSSTGSQQVHRPSDWQVEAEDPSGGPACDGSERRTGVLLGTRGPEVLAGRHTSREDRAWLAETGTRQAVPAKAKTDRWAVWGRGQWSPQGCGCL